MDWFRSWHGAPTDPKLAVIARNAGVTRCNAVACYWALLDFASQNDPRGSLEGIDYEVLSVALEMDESDIENIVQAMMKKGMVQDDLSITAWDKRQTKRDDDSSERVRAYRERKRNAVKRDVTQCNAPDKSREDKKDITSDFDSFWEAYPKKVGKGAAKKAYAKAVKSASPEQILSGVKTYKANKPSYADWAHPSTWLNAERWTDDYTDPKKRNVPDRFNPDDWGVGVGNA